MNETERTDKSAGGDLPERADPGGVATGAKRSGAAVALALIVIVVALVLVGLVADIF